MNKNNLKFLLAIVFASSSAGAADSFAASGSLSLAVPDVSALTVKEAHAKYGIESKSEHPFVFEVNAKLGPKKCVQIGPDCSFACPTPKIYSQSSHHYLNPDGSRTVRVDVYYDINQAVISREPSC